MSRPLSLMKAMIVTSALFYLAGSAAFAAGGGSSGAHGGSSVFVKGKWELADLFIHAPREGESMILSDEVVTFLEALRNVSAIYGFRANEFWDAQVFSSKVEFRYVSVLPCDDDPIDLGDDSLKQVSYGCTRDGITYLVKAELDKLSFESRALALVHERMHAIPDRFSSHTDIAEAIKGMATLVQVQQEQNAGVKRRLFADEIKAIARLQHLGTKLYGEPWKVGDYHQFGGGATKAPENSFTVPPRADLDRETFVGIGSYFQSLFSHGTSEGAVYHFPGARRSVVIDSAVIGQAGVWDSTLTRVTFEKGQIVASQITDSIIEDSTLVKNSPLKDVEIISSDVRGSRLADGSRISKSVVYRSALPKGKWDGTLIDRCRVYSKQSKKPGTLIPGCTIIEATDADLSPTT